MLKDLLGYTLGAVLGAALVLGLVYGWTATGPHCPGNADAAYIGWCK